MRKLLVFQHVALEPLGTLNQQFKDAGFRIRYINFDRVPGARVDLDKYHGLVVLGGPQAADQTDRFAHLAYEQEAIRDAIGRGLPTLGICLGAQLIAAALGGKTLRGAAPEFGWVDVAPTAFGQRDDLIGCFDERESIFQWHSDTFTLPHSAVHLAESQACRNQAFRLYDHVYGLQFHLEADLKLIRRWLASPGLGRELARRRIALDADEVLRRSRELLPRAAELGHAVFREFINRFYRFRRRHAHASR